jgi:hypothetical protein
MEDAMVDIPAALQAASTGVKILKDLNEVKKLYDDAPLKLKIAELSGTLAQVQMALVEAQKEIADKDAEIAKLQASFKRKAEGLVEHHGYYYRTGGDGKPRGRPHCPTCIQEGRIMMMTPGTRGPGRPHVCPACNCEVNHVEAFRFEEEPRS